MLAFVPQFVGKLLPIMASLVRELLQAALKAASDSEFDVDMASWHVEAVDLLMDAWCKWSICLQVGGY